VRTACTIAHIGLRETLMWRLGRSRDDRTMRTPRLLFTVAAVAASVTAACIAPAFASANAEPIVGTGNDLSAPAGVAQTPAGDVWVADPARGICRLSPAPSPRPVETPWCRPEAVEGPGDEEGEEDESSEEEDESPERIGPEDPSGIVFDPVSGYLYVSDRDSGGGGIWRLQLGADGAIDGGEPILTLGDRVSALALTPATVPDEPPDIVFATKRSGSVMRLPNPHSDPGPAVLLGSADDEATGIAVTEDSIYLADLGLWRLPLDGASPNQDAEPVAGFDGVPVTTVAVDAERRRLYAGTSHPFDLNVPQNDLVKVLDLETGSHEDYEQDFAGVTALALGDGGSLLVADDPVVVTGAEDVIGYGRLWRVPLHALGRPVAQLRSGPAPWSSATSATLSYASRDGAWFECRLGAEGWARCPGTTSGEVTYDELPEGSHRFEVRAVDGESRGLAARHSFTIDRTAPKVRFYESSIELMDGDPAPRIRFTADEDEVAFECSLDDAPFESCSSGNAIDDLGPGVHVLRVVGTDRTGNTSDPLAPGAALTITVRRPTQPEPPAEPPMPRPTPPAATPPAATPPAATPPAATPPAANRPAPQTAAATSRPARYRFRLHLDRLRRVSRTRLSFALDVPAGARHLHLAIASRSGRSGVRRRVAIPSGAAPVVRLRLTDREIRRLRPGRYRVTAVLRTSDGASGRTATRWLRVRAVSRPTARRGHP
jgi:hypothetical protein